MEKQLDQNHPVKEEEEEEEEVDGIGSKREIELDWISTDNEGHQEDATSLCVVGRLWTDRRVNLRAVIDTMCKAWRTKGGVDGDVIHKQNKIFTFIFNDESDKRRVLQQQPWHFDRHLFIIADLQVDAIPTEVPLFFTPLWARVYDLPILGRHNVDNAINIGNALGTFVAHDDSVNPRIIRCLRIRVILDVRKALVDSITLKRRGGSAWKARIAYEGLPIFCYVCGHVGHGEKDCKERKGMMVGEGRRFGEDLKASSWRVSRELLFETNEGSKEMEEKQLHRMVELLRGEGHSSTIPFPTPLHDE